MNVKLSFLVFLASVAVCASAASAPQASIRLSIAHVPVPSSTGKGMAVVFRGDPLVATVAINFVRMPNADGGHASAAGVFELPSASWWNAIQWTLVDANGNRRSIDATHVRLLRDSSIRHPDVPRPRSGYFIVEGERPEVTLNLGQLPVADYTISARFLSLSTREMHFSVREGNETPELRRAFLHYSLQTRPGTYEDAKRILFQLATLEPTNAGNFIELGDIALMHGSGVDAASAYARASEIVAENKRRLMAARQLTPDEEHAFTRELNRLADLQSLGKTLAASKSGAEVQMLPTAEGKEYRLIDRATGAAIRIVK